MERLYQIDTGYACAGVLVEDGIITNAAPIFRWMIGKTPAEVKQWKKIKRITKCRNIS